MKPLDLTKPMKTRCGFTVRIYAQDGESTYPIHGAASERDGWVSRSWADNGRHQYLNEGALDLVNVPEKRTLRGYVNIYPDPYTPMFHFSRIEADKAATSDRIACVVISHEYELP